MVLYTILAIIIIVLIIVGIMFYLRSNKRKIVEEEERKLKVQRLPFEENLKQLSELNLKGETRKNMMPLKRHLRLYK